MNKISQESDMNFFLPIEFEKSVNKKTGEKEMKIKGIASTPDKDSDGEILEPVGFDLSRFKSFGFLNYNHGAKNDASKVIGEPTLAKITPKGEFYVEGKLYSGHPLAESVYNLAETLERNGSNRKIGFSIEGRAVERDPMNPKRITKSLITGLAITPMPVNTNTYLDICKGAQKEDFLDVKTDDILKKSEESDILYEFEIDDKLYTINKSFEVNEIEKGGEGSRGGKIIGHTRSGKPIYDTPNHPSHKDFTPEDHEDSSEAHFQGRGRGKYEKMEEHEKLRKQAIYYDKQKEGIIGQTRTGKNIYRNPEHESHKNFTMEDHEDAAYVHSAHREHAYRQDHRDGSQEYHKKAMDKHEELANKKAYGKQENPVRRFPLSYDATSYLNKSIVPDIEKETEEQAKVKKVMREFKAGTLKSSDGKTVTDRDQALAIAMSEAGIEKTMDVASFAPVTKQSIDPKVKVLDIGTKDIIKKALELDIISFEQLIEKSQGEGSRGGKIIGHTKSGKPVYDKSNHKEHSNFSAEDHNDAAKLHDKEMNELGHRWTPRDGKMYNKYKKHESERNNHSKLRSALLETEK